MWWGARAVGLAAAMITAATLAARAEEPAVSSSGFDPAVMADAAAGLRPLVPGVAVLGEAEVAAFLAGAGSGQGGLLLDARLPEAAAAGSIPGALSLPAVTLTPDNPAREAILFALGGQAQGDGTWSAEGAPVLVIFDDGITGGGEAATALEALLAAGWPAARLGHYRGGLRDWQAAGLALAVADGG